MVTGAVILPVPDIVCEPAPKRKDIPVMEPLLITFPPFTLKDPLETELVNKPPAAMFRSPLSAMLWLVIFIVAPLAIRRGPPIVLLEAVVVPLLTSSRAEHAAFTANVVAPCKRILPAPVLVQVPPLVKPPVFKVNVNVPTLSVPPALIDNDDPAKPAPIAALLARLVMEL